MVDGPLSLLQTRSENKIASLSELFRDTEKKVNISQISGESVARGRVDIILFI